MQAARLTDSLGLPQSIAEQFVPESAPTSVELPLWVVRDPASGVRYWLEYLAPSAEREGQLADAAKVLQGNPPHLLPLAKAQLAAPEPYLLYHWAGEQPLTRPFASPARERAALELLESINTLQLLPEPAALPELELSQLWILPRTGTLRVAGLAGIVAGAGVDARRAGRSACAAVLAGLLAEDDVRGGMGESDQEALAAWENDGAEAYPALYTALQRLQLVGLIADF